MRPAERRGLGAALAAVAAASLLPRLVAAMLDPINYDGYWHVFIARNLPREWSSLAHPPLFPLLLRLCDSIRHSRLSYQAVSIAAGTGSVFLFGRVLEKLRARRSVALLGAAAFGLSPSAIRLSSVVESYMLCVFFVLAAFLFYLEVVPAQPDASGRHARLAFSIFATLALLSHYVAGLFFAACVVAPALIALARPRYALDLRKALPERFSADAAAILLPGGVGLALYLFLARPWVRNLNHLPEFYFRPGEEGAGTYLVRNLGNTFNLFSPIRVGASGVAAAFLAILALIAWISVGTRAREPDAGQQTERLAPAVLFVLLLLFEAGAGLLGKYPFGGVMRHQVLLLVFGMLAALVALDQWIYRTSPGGRRVIIGLLLLAVTANATLNHREWLSPGPDPFASDVRTFRTRFPDARTVDLDQFNLIGFFAQHHDWHWSFLGWMGNPRLQQYRISKAERTLTVVAHRDVWNMDFFNRDTYEALSLAPERGVSTTFHVFCVHQILPGESVPDAGALRSGIPQLAAASGLAAESLLVQGPNVFAAFRAANPSVHPPPTVTSIVPRGTKAGVGFQIQPDGSSAISVFGAEFRRGAIVTVNEHPLDTTFGNPGWVTAIVPGELYARPGRLAVRVINPDGLSSNTIELGISP